MKEGSQNNGCGWAIAIVLGLLLIGQCSDDPPISDSDYLQTAPQTTSSLPDRNLDGEIEDIDPITMYVTASSVNCRSGPSTSHRKINSFGYAEALSVSNTDSGWSEIPQSSCWISSRFLSEEEPEPAPVVQKRQYSAPSRLYNAPPQSSRSCGGKWKCGQMNSCNEAYHYLNNCGLGRLDGDGDGVPCESIC